MIARRTLTRPLRRRGSWPPPRPLPAQLTHQAPNPRVIITTSLGTITVELAADKAPITTANFLKYVDRRLYDGNITFYRASKPPGQTDQRLRLDPRFGRPARRRPEEEAAAHRPREHG